MEIIKLFLKFIEENVTAIMVTSSLIGGIILMITEVIPDVVPINEFTTFVGTMVGLYVVRTTAKKFVDKKKV